MFEVFLAARSYDPRVWTPVLPAKQANYGMKMQDCGFIFLLYLPVRCRCAVQFIYSLIFRDVSNL